MLTTGEGNKLQGVEVLPLDNIHTSGSKFLSTVMTCCRLFRLTRAVNLKRYIQFLVLVFILGNMTVLFYTRSGIIQLIRKNNCTLHQICPEIHTEKYSQYRSMGVKGLISVTSKTSKRGLNASIINKANRGRISETPQQFQEWLHRNETTCNGQLIEYSNLFTHMRDVTVDRRYAIGQDGGQDMRIVLNQPEWKEYYTLKRGFFGFICPNSSSPCKLNKVHQTHLSLSDKIKVPWTNFALCKKAQNYSKSVSDRFTVAVQRYEYANMYHTMTDWYNAFLMTKFFQKDPKDVDILFLDAHPEGSLDQTWSKLFGRTKRLGQFHEPVHFKSLVMSILGYDSLLSPLYRHLKEIPFLDDFKDFFLRSHGIATDRELNCKNISVLFLWRHDYVAHPRNPSGRIKRKISNEKELISKARAYFPDHTISGVQIDSYDMQHQLDMIAKTDILIGMHGAGLTHAVFLPKHAGLIEYFPNYSGILQHFMSIAKWRKLNYQQWQNTYEKNEFENFSTKLPVNVVMKHIEIASSAMCKK